MSGKVVNQCYRADVSSQSLCEDDCTSLTSCIGYQYYAGKNTYCYLIPSERNCPSGFLPHYESGPIAISMNDLKSGPMTASMNETYVCYGKG